MKNSAIKQKGAALVVGLIMLLVMTLMGVTSMNATRTELKIANNLNNHSTAFQTAAMMFERVLVSAGINWADATNVPQTGSVTSADALRAGGYAMTFVGCRNAAASSITSANRARSIVHEVAVTGNALNSGGKTVGVSRQRGGFATLAAGCEPPSAP